MPRLGQSIVPGLLMALLPSAWPAPSAVAQQADTPLFLPTSDVTVFYQFDRVPEDGQLPHALRITYAKAGERVRLDAYRWVEAKYPYWAVIFDRPANRVITVYPERKAYVERPVGNSDNPGALLSGDMVFTRQGNDVVAHAPCTVWKVVEHGKGDTGDTACVTDDGIVLRRWSPMKTVATMTATTIRYGPPPDGVFNPPAGYKSQPPPS